MIDAIQKALVRECLDGWLFFDHHRRDPIAYRILKLAEHLSPSRRWYYYVPASGSPSKLVHRIEEHVLGSLPGKKLTYSSWVEQESRLGDMLPKDARVALQYSPNCLIPYVSLVDAGTVDLLRSLGVRPETSANLVQEFEATWTAGQLSLHRKAGELVDLTRREAFNFIGERLQNRVYVDEFEVQQFIVNKFFQRNLFTEHGPIVAVNSNASDPHYEPTAEAKTEIRPGDVVLIDLWAKLKEPDSVYYDVTWTGYCGDVIPSRISRIFDLVCAARQGACRFVSQAFQNGRTVMGWQVDDAARNVIREGGFADYFFHRTGHSIGTEVHGTGANMDNWESRDERRLIPNTCFSVEPGIYLPEFGIRSEVNVFIGDEGASVTGEQQNQMLRI